MPRNSIVVNLRTKTYILERRKTVGFTVKCAPQYVIVFLIILLQVSHRLHCKCIFCLGMSMRHVASTRDGHVSPAKMVGNALLHSKLNSVPGIKCTLLIILNSFREGHYICDAAPRFFKYSYPPIAMEGDPQILNAQLQRILDVAHNT